MILLSNPWFGIPLFALATTSVALGVYFFLRRSLNLSDREEAHALSSSIIFRIGALHGLIVALIFAQEQLNYMEAEKTITREAAAISDTYYELENGEFAEAQAVQELIIRYVRKVVKEEWGGMHTGRLHDETWSAYASVERALLRLPAVDDIQADIKRSLLNDWDIISELRREREATARDGIPSIFWMLAVSGYVLVMAPYFIFQPNRFNLFLIVTYAVYYGMAMYTIWAMDNPFTPPADISPEPFEKILDSVEEK